ncbi:hypothetical protein RRG08_057901 [Elysia crispata]|uniref:Uncharacterized protein n=1 Tax=Elysia crispata TaxID=231223 RepID=A0AAE0ZQV2_9GAST|nr:hypothetical protein RRG08_057901 [Elysia crispata]
MCLLDRFPPASSPGRQYTGSYTSIACISGGDGRGRHSQFVQAETGSDQAIRLAAPSRHKQGVQPQTGFDWEMRLSAPSQHGCDITSAAVSGLFTGNTYRAEACV